MNDQPFSNWQLQYYSFILSVDWNANFEFNFGFDSVCKLSIKLFQLDRLNWNFKLLKSLNVTLAKTALNCHAAAIMIALEKTFSLLRTDRF